MRSVTRAIALALMASGTAFATDFVSLSDFAPRVYNLPIICQNVYTKSVDGCTAHDFNRDNDNRCSSACVSGLLKIAQEIGSACAFADVPGDSIIGVFLHGDGVPTLCPGVTVTTIAPSSTPAPASSSAPAQSTSTSSEDDDDDEPATTSESSSTTSTAAASSTSSGAIIVDTSFATSATAVATSADAQPAASTGASSSAKASTTANSQKSNKDSGGGSPFDVQATGGSVSLQTLSSLTMASIVATAVLFSVLF